VTPSVTEPGDTNLSDATEICHGIFLDFRHLHRVIIYTVSQGNPWDFGVWVWYNLASHSLFSVISETVGWQQHQRGF